MEKEILYYCEKCNQPVYQNYGSGRFCSRKCSNSRTFSVESRMKKSIANSGKIAYSNNAGVKYFKSIDEIPEGYIKGNITISNYTDINDFQNRNKNKKYKPKSYSAKIKSAKPKKLSATKILELNSEYIKNHNDKVMNEYIKYLKECALNKTEQIFNNQFMFAKCASITMDHKRGHEGHVFVHILLAEQLLGRNLTETEIVHHINEDKLDNRFSNYLIFNNKASHARYHYAKYYWLSIDSNKSLQCDRINISLLPIK